MLDENRLSGLFEDALNAESDKKVDPAEARKRMAKAMAKAVIEEMKAATISVGGVTTTGTSTSQTQVGVVKATIT